MSEIFVPSAREIYAEHRKNAAAIADIESSMKPERAEELSRAVNELVKLIMQGWQPGRKYIEEEHLSLEREIKMLAGQNNWKIYMNKARGDAKARYVYESFRNEWHAQAITEAQQAGVQLNL